MADGFRERMLAATKADRAQERQLTRRIAELYEKAAEDMAQKAADSRAGSLTERRAWELSQSLRERTQDLWSQVGDLTRAGMREAALRSVGVQTTFLEDAGRMAQLDLRQSIRGSFGSVADDAVRHVLAGGVYGGKSPTLSKRIWNNEALQSGKIEQIIAQAVAKGESPQKLAKALEAYVNPKAAEPSNWNDIYDIPFTYKVDYNAKRLAVTSLRHASWGATLRAGEKNPYADFLQWELTSAHVIYDVCDGYAVHEEGLGEGRYALNSPHIPLPHPFCTCLYYVDTDKSLEQVADELVSWADGEREDERLDRAFGEWERTKINNSLNIASSNVPDNAILLGEIKQEIIGELNTVSNDIYLFPERLEHISQRHKNDTDIILSELPACIKKPVLVLQEKADEQMVHFLKQHDNKTFVDAIVKMSNTPELVNSVITGMRIRHRGVLSLQRKCRTLYIDK